MRLSLIKCFSILVVSGNGARCNEMRQKLHDTLFQVDAETGMSKLFLHKWGREEHKDHFFRVGREVYRAITPLLSDVKPIFFGQDRESQPAARQRN